MNTKREIIIRGNYRLLGTLWWSDKKRPKHAVIFCHGFGANRSFGPLGPLAEGLAHAGYGVLSFDARGCGLSEEAHHPTYLTLGDDLVAAHAFLKESYQPEKIFLLGHSMGGTVVILRAQELDVAGIITLGAVAYPEKSAATKKDQLIWKDGVGSITLNDKTYTFTEEFFEDAKKVNPLFAIASLKAEKLIIHGTADKRIALEEAKELFTVAHTPKALKLVDQVGHNFGGQEETLFRTILTHLKQWTHSSSSFVVPDR